jgi:drug/metabolite transporter (DMT)-like permease
MVGVGIVAPAFDLGNPQFQGLAWGMASGLSYAVLSIGNRDMVPHLGSLKLAFSEQAFALAFLLPFVLGLELRLTIAEVSLLALLGVVFTGLSHSLFIDSLKVVRPQAASLASALEPVYGILFSALLLGQLPKGREVAGGLLIIAAIALPGKRPWGSLKKGKVT